MADVTTTFAAKDESFAKTVTNLQGRLTDFGGSVNGFSSQVSGMASAFAKFAGPIAAFGLAFLGAKSAVQSFTEAISMGGRLNDLSSRTGETAGNLAILQRAFDNAGSSAESVGPVLNKIQRAIVEADQGTQKFVDAFSALGVSMDSFKGKSPTEQLQIIAEALNKVKDPAQRSAIAMELLGKSGGELIPLLRAMGVELETARNQLGSYPKAIDSAAKALDDIGDNFNAISKKGMEFATGLMVDLAPALAEITAKIAEIDAAGFGMMISEYVMKMVQGIDGALRFSDAIDNVKLAIEAMAQGEMGKGLELMFVTMKITALNAINEIVRNFIAGLQTIGDFIGKMFSPSGALILLIQTAFTIGANYFKEALFSAMAEVASNFGPWGEKIAKTMLYKAETASSQIETLTKGIGSQIELVGEQAAEAGAAMPDTFAAKKAALDPLFSLKDEFAQQKTLQEEITAKIAQAAGPAAEIAESAKAVSLALGGVPETLQSSVDLSGQLFTNLNNASIAATEVEPAFSLAAEATGKMALDLQTTSAAAGTAGDFIEEANYHTAQMSLNGSNFAANAALAASNIGAAKVDALIVADAFTGMSERMQQGAGSVEASLDKMREAHHFGQQTSEEVYKKLTDGGMGIVEAQQAASDYMKEQSQMSADMQKAELQQRLAQEKLDRAEKRAQDLEARGLDKAANDLRMRAQEAFTKKMEELAPQLEKGVETAKKMLEESGKETGEKLKDGAKEAGKTLTEAGKDVAKALKDVISPEGKDKEKNFAEQIFNFFKNEFFMDFKTRLPQNALS
jgi:hypothetical protein